MSTDLNRALRAMPLKAHFALLIGVFVVVAIASALYIHRQTYRDAEHAAHTHARYAARIAAKDLGAQVVTLKTQIHILAATPGLEATFSKPEQCRLQAVGGHIDVIPPSGIVACSSRPVKGKRDYSRADWFRRAMKGDVFIAPVRDVDGHWVVVAASPMPKGRGVAAGLFDLEAVGADFARKYSGGEPFLFVISDGHRIIARSIQPRSYIGQPVLATAQPHHTLFTATDLNGVERFFAPERVPGVGWRLVAGEKTSAATAPGRDLERRQFGILIVGLVLMLIATTGSYWLFTLPIRDMRRAVRADEPLLPTTGPRELGALAGDINAMLGRQERERQAQKMEALGRLASGIAHDFNNLLLVISSGARSLLRRELDEKGTESVHRIDRAAHRGQQLTTQLLAFARQRVVAPVPTDMNTVVREMSAMLDRLLGKNVVAHVELTPELPPILIDEGQLAQVVLNLAINASDAMPDGGTVHIRTSAVEVGADEEAVPGRYVQLEVEDTGAGMSADTLGRVFDPFFTTKAEGTGLGLATVHGIVTAAGGLIDVTSEIGKGTTFRMRFPHSTLGEELMTSDDEEVVA